MLVLKIAEKGCFIECPRGPRNREKRGVFCTKKKLLLFILFYFYFFFCLFFLSIFFLTCRDMVCVDDIVDITPVDDGPTSYQGTLGQGIGTVNILF